MRSALPQAFSSLPPPFQSVCTPHTLAVARCTAHPVSALASRAAAADEHFMGLALQQARTAFDAGEVPIGAVLVINSQVVAAAHNLTETRHNPLCHAELLCISAAAEQQLAWRLPDATLYSTVEPCPMCAGAILQSRLARLVYGAKQPRVGADGSWIAMLPQQQDKQQQGVLPQQQEPQLQHTEPLPQPAPHQLQQQQQQLPVQPMGPHPFHPHLLVTCGVRAHECAALMRAFFRERRKQERARAPAAAAGGLNSSSSDSTEPGGDSSGDSSDGQHGNAAAAPPAAAAAEFDPSAVWLGSSLDSGSECDST